MTQRKKVFFKKNEEGNTFVIGHKAVPWLSRALRHLSIHLSHPWPLIACSQEPISNYFNQATFKWLRWRGFLQLPLGESIPRSDTHHCFVLLGLVRKFPFQICLLFSTKNLLYWEELGYHMLVS